VIESVVLDWLKSDVPSVPVTNGVSAASASDALVIRVDASSHRAERGRAVAAVIADGGQRADAQRVDVDLVGRASGIADCERDLVIGRRRLRETTRAVVVAIRHHEPLVVRLEREARADRVGDRTARRENDARGAGDLGVVVPVRAARVGGLLAPTTATVSPVMSSAPAAGASISAASSPPIRAQNSAS
jgi:hypothetical protein